MRADYSFADRLLHRIALGSIATAETLHDIERTRFLKVSPEDRGGHVIVTSLARAGSTILLRELYATGAFASLTYADMPFVLAPNSWASISSRLRHDFEPVERAHGDGIRVNLESPEALDQVFWRVFCGKSYIRPDGLLPHRPAKRDIARYRDFMRLVMRRAGKPRYLAKGNNNILRLDALASAMPDTTFLLVVRDPLAHARSMLAQHRRFSDPGDTFRRDYMRWLVHHEFGIDHRPYRFPGAPEGDTDTLDYWLGVWTACYTALEPVANAHANVLVVPYEALCNRPELWNALCARLDLPVTVPRELSATGLGAASAADPAAEEARTIQARYLARACEWWGG
ncbi:MAG: sulfotransferase [Novosphingobium sp.]